MKVLSEESKAIVINTRNTLSQENSSAAQLLVEVIEFLDEYAFNLQRRSFDKQVGSNVEEATVELSIDVLKIRCTLLDNRLLCEVFVVGVKAAEYYLERNGGRVFGKAPAGVGDAEFELWWESENIHGKVRVCKSIFGAVVCTGWAEGSVRV